MKVHKAEVQRWRHALSCRSFWHLLITSLRNEQCRSVDIGTGMQSNARLSLDCLALVTGLAYDGDSMTEIAKRHDVTLAAVSKRCVELTQSLNLKPSRAMRSLLARQSYRKARMNHLQTHP